VSSIFLIIIVALLIALSAKEVSTAAEATENRILVANVAPGQFFVAAGHLTINWANFILGNSW